MIPQHNQQNALEQKPNYVTLIRLTLSASTDYEFELNLSGYQIKLLMWGLHYLEHHETGIAQLDYPKAQWARLRTELQKFVDQQGEAFDPDLESENHLDVTAQILSSKRENEFNPESN